MKCRQHLTRWFLAAAVLSRTAVAHLVDRAACDSSSVYSVLSRDATGSAFCSTLLYPGGPSTVTNTVVVTSTKPCKTGTTTVTEHTTKTVTVTYSVTPQQLYTSYGSTALVPSGHHHSINKRAPQAGSTSTGSSTSTTTSTTTSTSTSTSTATLSTTVSAAAAATPAVVAGIRQCSPTPSKLCNCPAQSISSACLALAPSPSVVTSTDTETTTVQCPKTEVTVTKTVRDGVTTSTYTDYATPPVKTISKPNKTLTTTVPAICAGTPYKARGGNGEPGNTIAFVEYPDQPQTPVECCVVCYERLSRYPNCVASAFLAGDCQLLLKVNATAGEKTSAECPVGIENYHFGNPAPKGVTYPGPCSF